MVYNRTMDLFKEQKKFSTPYEELEYLRKRVAEHEKTAENAGMVPDTEKLVKAEIDLHRKKLPHDVLAPKSQMTEVEISGFVLKISPEEHDTKLSELMALVKTRGVYNALSVISKMKNPHIEDDFHRMLVALVKGGYETRLSPKDTTTKALKMTLFEIQLPEQKNEDKKPLKELISSMEQLFSGLMSISQQTGKEPNLEYFTMELAMPNVGEEYSFFVAMPDSRQELFEKHILSVYPSARLIPKRDDYNIFNEDGHTVGACATSGGNPIYPIKTYDLFDHDPINAILNSFSKMKKEGEGASIQFVFKPVGDNYIKKYSYALEQIMKGKDVSESIDIPDSIGGELFKTAKDIFKTIKKKEGEDEKKDPIDQTVIDEIKKKISSPIVQTNIRIVVSAEEEKDARDILGDIESAFNQFENTKGNSFVWKELKRGSLTDMLRNFTFRTFNSSQNIPLSLSEVATIMHFQTKAIETASNLKFNRLVTAPAPAGLTKEGILLGVNRHSSSETPIYMSKEDRLRHIYTIGQTGTGKSTFLKNLVVQDIKNGEGVCMIDPHGSDIQDILATIPEERYEDVIYFDPSNVERPISLNMLEYDRRFPEQKTFVVNEMLSIFNKLFDMKVAGGPMFEQYFRNAVMLVMEDPETGNTLLDVSRVLADKGFRELKLSRCKNPVIVGYWRDIADKAGGEADIKNIVPYITSKFDVFLSNDIMRPIVAQEKSSFNFREIMDQKKILLVNLSKGRLGDINANLLGLIIVGKILMAALSRVDSFGQDLPPFYLYIDEFQNITTDSISTILSEARKYKLSLNIAHQFIAQLDEKISDSVFGNVGSMVAFRVGSEDAEFLEKQFTPVFTARELMNIENRNAYIKMLSDGTPIKPFSIGILPPEQGNKEKVEPLKELSGLKYGKDRKEVDEAIMAKYKATKNL